MSVNDRYTRIDDLPGSVPIFPLAGCILLPRSKLPLNIFEPRYLAMIDHALGADRLVGIVQPNASEGDGSPQGKSAALRTTACLGRITSFSETDDNRYIITLTGITRVTLGAEVRSDEPFRSFAIDAQGFAGDLVPGFGQEAVDWSALLEALRSYLRARDIDADWDNIERAPPEMLVNTLAVISPYGAEEKQALLEAADLKTRAEILMALAAMELASQNAETPGSIQ